MLHVFDTLCLINSKPKLTKALFANFQISKNLLKRKNAPSKQISYFWKTFVFKYVYIYTHVIRLKSIFTSLELMDFLIPYLFLEPEFNQKKCKIYFKFR